MMNSTKNTPAIAHLRYKKGDLIIKEGDFGLTIYKIVTGKVEILNEVGGRERLTATLDPGQIIGEMAFLTKGAEPRTASARAVEDTELEVWHPDTLSKEYDEMPPIIKLIINQNLNRLMRMNRFVIQLQGKKQQGPEKRTQQGPETSKRQFFRKEVDLHCFLRPMASMQKSPFNGRIKDLSNSGAGVEVGRIGAADNFFKKEAEFHMKTTLPNAKVLNAIAKIIHWKEDEASGKIFLGMEFTEMSYDSRTILGFFLRS
jgi:CRP-like cAMP-binding protein